MTTGNSIIDLLQARKSSFSELGIRRIGLFGSYVRNEQNANSDIDILIDFDPESENFDNLMAAADLLEKMFEDHKVEVVTKGGLSPYIGPKILEEVRYV